MLYLHLSSCDLRKGHSDLGHIVLQGILPILLTRTDRGLGGEDIERCFPGYLSVFL